MLCDVGVHVHDIDCKEKPTAKETFPGTACPVPVGQIEVLVRSSGSVWEFPDLLRTTQTLRVQDVQDRRVGLETFLSEGTNFCGHLFVL